MANVVYIEKYTNKKVGERSVKAEKRNILDMVCDSKKRKEAYEYYDNAYQDSVEEKQIFESWRKRRVRRKY